MPRKWSEDTLEESQQMCIQTKGSHITASPIRKRVQIVLQRPLFAWVANLGSTAAAAKLALFTQQQGRRSELSAAMAAAASREGVQALRNWNKVPLLAFSPQSVWHLSNFKEGAIKLTFECNEGGEVNVGRIKSPLNGFFSSFPSLSRE